MLARANYVTTTVKMKLQSFCRNQNVRDLLARTAVALTSVAVEANLFANTWVLHALDNLEDSTDMPPLNSVWMNRVFRSMTYNEVDNLITTTLNAEQGNVQGGVLEQHFARRAAANAGEEFDWIYLRPLLQTYSDAYTVNCANHVVLNVERRVRRALRDVVTNLDVDNLLNKRARDIIENFYVKRLQRDPMRIS